MIALRHVKPLLSAALLAFALLPTAGRAQDAPRLPDWKGQWIRTGSGSFDPGKPPGLRHIVVRDAGHFTPSPRVPSGRLRPSATG
jgi:hypothetical protein